VAIVGLCAAVSGCAGAGATRLPTRAKGSGGEAIQRKDLDLTFLQGDTARREEVVQRLSSIDTGYANPRLFWGRWTDSKWGYGWFDLPCSTKRCSGGTGDAKRVWHLHNLLVTFDENGVMQKKELISDDKVFWRELHEKLTEAPVRELPQATTLSAHVRTCPEEITLTKEWMQIASGCKKAGVVKISPLKIVRISHGGLFMDKSHAGTTCHSLYLSEDSAMGKKISFCTDGAQVATVFQYLQQVGPSNMRWE
jgi:hypothetical protein